MNTSIRNKYSPKKAKLSPNKRYAFRRTIRAAPGSEKPQSGYALCAVLSPPHFAVAGLATQALIRNRKTSVT